MKSVQKNMRTLVTHEFPALYDRNSRVLLLGSIPSPKSREQGFYYGHPQNRFWKVLAAVLGESVPETIPQKKAMLKKHHIALWDVLESCTIVGASDTSIEDVVPNKWLLKNSRPHRPRTAPSLSKSSWKPIAKSYSGQRAVAKHFIFGAARN